MESKGKDKDSSKITAAPSKEKPTSRGELALTYTPWTKTELKNLTKDFPDPLQDALGFAK